MFDESRFAEALRRFLRAEVYLPFPAAVALLVALIVFTASLTVIITYWPASAPELAENPRLASLEAVLTAPGQGALLPETPLKAAAGAASPVALIDPPALATPPAFPQMEARQKVMPVRHARAVTGPDAAIALAARNAPGAAPKMEAAALPDFSRLENMVPAIPVAELALREASPPVVAEKIGGRQTVLPRRYANAVTTPERVNVSTAGAAVSPVRPPAENLFPAEEGKPWRKYAAAVPMDAGGKPKIVIVIDDLGNAPAMTQALAALEGPLTFAFLPYATGLAGQTRMVRAKGHELMVHLPMEPQGSERPGPNALYSSLSDDEIASALDWNLSRFEGYVGVNNHMGSALTEDARVMRLILAELKARGLLFLDSMTTPDSVAGKVAVALDLPTAKRDVFLDNEATDAAIQAQLMVLERTARAQGFAIAIGHPNRATLRALQSWIPSIRERGFALVPLSAVVEFEGKRRLAAAGGN